MMWKIVTREGKKEREKTCASEKLRGGTVGYSRCLSQISLLERENKE